MFFFSKIKKSTADGVCFVSLRRDIGHFDSALFDPNLQYSTTATHPVHLVVTRSVRLFSAAVTDCDAEQRGENACADHAVHASAHRGQVRRNSLYGNKSLPAKAHAT